MTVISSFGCLIAGFHIKIRQIRQVMKALTRDRFFLLQLPVPKDCKFAKCRKHCA